MSPALNADLASWAEANEGTASATPSAKMAAMLRFIVLSLSLNRAPGRRASWSFYTEAKRSLGVVAVHGRGAPLHLVGAGRERLAKRDNQLRLFAPLDGERAGRHGAGRSGQRDFREFGLDAFAEVKPKLARRRDGRADCWNRPFELSVGESWRRGEREGERAGKSQSVCAHGRYSSCQIPGAIPRPCGKIGRPREFGKISSR